MKIKSLGMKLYGKWLLSCRGFIFPVEGKTAQSAIASLRRYIKELEQLPESL